MKERLEKCELLVIALVEVREKQIEMEEMERGGLGGQVRGEVDVHTMGSEMENREFDGNGGVGDRVGRGVGRGRGGYGGRGNHGNEYDGGMGEMGDVRDYMYGVDGDWLGGGGPVGVCWGFMRGNCKFGMRCKFRHVIEDA